MYRPGEKESMQIERAFAYHPPQPDQIPRYESVRNHGKLMAKCLLGLCPPSRELSLALSSIEAAVMWANAAIARNEPNHGQEKQDAYPTTTEEVAKRGGSLPLDQQMQCGPEEAHLDEH